MKIQNKWFSAGFKAALSLCGLVGILIQCGVFSGELNFGIFRYYTILSNVLCTGYFAAAAVYAARGRETVLPRFKSMLIMSITVTGLIYHFMLSGGTFSMGGTFALANILLHYFTPAMSVLDWLLFDRKGRYTALQPFFWVLLPNIYFVLATLYGFFSGQTFMSGSRFPYFFMDFDLLGVWKVLLYVVILNILFLGLGYVFYFADRLMGRKKRPSGKASEATKDAADNLL